MRLVREVARALVGALAALLVFACGATDSPPIAADPAHTQALAASAPVGVGNGQLPITLANPPTNVYGSTRDMLVNPTVAGITPRVYVPNSDANTVTEIDPNTFKVITTFPVGQIPHHIAPSWDLTKLYVDDEGSSDLDVIDPSTGSLTSKVPVPYPYNLYFTPDGSKAIVVVERLSRIDFRDPTTWQLLKSVQIPYPGDDHLDFSADGSYLMLSTEWSGEVIKIDTNSMSIVGQVNVGGYPIDVRLSPDGTVFYVTNQLLDGIHVIDGDNLKQVGWIPGGHGAHGLTISRDTTQLYISNRLAGTISVLDIATNKIVQTWKVGGSPDMIQLSPDGKQLWTTGRFDGYVYVIDTSDGHLLAKIYSGAGAHGLTYFPNVGLHSTGHNGVYR